MNSQQLLQKIKELTPSCNVAYGNDVNEEVLQLYLLFVARCQMSVSKMYDSYDIKPCKYMGRQFYRISHAFKRDNGYTQPPHYYPFVNVDAETLDMFCANGKVPRANLRAKNYVCCGYGWQETNSKLLSKEQKEQFEEFITQHNLK